MHRATSKLSRKRVTHLRRKVIGGTFGLAAAGAAAVVGQRSALSFPAGANVMYLANARSGIRLFVQGMAPATVWLPSYICTSVPSVLRDLPSFVRYYPVDHKLAITDGRWFDDVSAGDLFCVVAYFGRPAERTWIARAHAHGALVLEDASQALLSDNIGIGVDAYVYSPRKFVGVADGGILVCSADLPWPIAFDEPPVDWLSVQIRSALARRDFDARGANDDDRSWYKLFQLAEDAPVGVFPMNPFTRAMLDCAFNWKQIAERRTANWNVLANWLHPIALWSKLEPGVIPLGFVVRLPDERTRDHVRSNLIADNIYPPVHWDLGKHVPHSFTSSHQLARRMLTLPCDQRYDEQDMRRVADAVISALRTIDAQNILQD